MCASRESCIQQRRPPRRCWPLTLHEVALLYNRPPRFIASNIEFALLPAANPNPRHFARTTPALLRLPGWREPAEDAEREDCVDGAADGKQAQDHLPTEGTGCCAGKRPSEQRCDRLARVECSVRLADVASAVKVSCEGGELPRSRDRTKDT